MHEPRPVKMTKVKLDRERTLTYDFNALEAFEDVTGIDLLKKGAFDPSDLGTKKLKVLLWAGLIHDDPALTLRDVGGMVDPANFPEVFSAVMEAWGLAMPVPTETSPEATEVPLAG